MTITTTLIKPTLPSSRVTEGLFTHKPLVVMKATLFLFLLWGTTAPISAQPAQQHFPGVGHTRNAWARIQNRAQRRRQVPKHPVRHPRHF